MFGRMAHGLIDHERECSSLARIIGTCFPPLWTSIALVNMVPVRKDIDRTSNWDHAMPRSRFEELVALAEENDGLVTAGHARLAGFADSVLARLVRRERIVRIARGVYRTPYFPPARSPNTAKLCFGRKRTAAAVLSLSRTRRPSPCMGFLMPIRSRFISQYPNPHACGERNPKV